MQYLHIENLFPNKQILETTVYFLFTWQFNKAFIYFCYWKNNSCRDMKLTFTTLSSVLDTFVCHIFILCDKSVWCVPLSPLRDKENAVEM